MIEHTWGLDEKITLHDSVRWTGDALAELRTEPATKRFEASWAEQRAYVDQAAESCDGRSVRRQRHRRRRVGGHATFATGDA